MSDRLVLLQINYYPEGIPSYSEGLPQRGTPGNAKSKKMNLEKVPSPKRTSIDTTFSRLVDGL